MLACTDARVSSLASVFYLLQSACCSHSVCLHGHFEVPCLTVYPCNIKKSAHMCTHHCRFFLCMLNLGSYADIHIIKQLIYYRSHIGAPVAVSLDIKL